MLLQNQLTETAIRDTLSEVFRHVAYSRTVQETIGERLLNWVRILLTKLFAAAFQHPFILQSARALLILAVVAIICRSAFLAYQRARLKARARADAAGGFGADGMQDAWLLAQRYASEGKYTEAAHAVYWHLLEWLSQRESLSLHPSKTVGDYARDLRARSSRLFNNYRDFARSYEVVIYGLGSCDRERYDRLLSLATAITRKNG